MFEQLAQDAVATIRKVTSRDNGDPMATIVDIKMLTTDIVSAMEKINKIQSFINELNYDDRRSYADAKYRRGR